MSCYRCVYLRGATSASDRRYFLFKFQIKYVHCLCVTQTSHARGCRGCAAEAAAAAAAACAGGSSNGGGGGGACSGGGVLAVRLVAMLAVCSSLARFCFNFIICDTKESLLCDISQILCTIRPAQRDFCYALVSFWRPECVRRMAARRRLLGSTPPRELSGDL